VIPVRVTSKFVYLRRPVLVAVSLADLRGPVSGAVELPLQLFWSGTDGWFSLDHRSGRRQVYQIVLREARRPDDLATFLNGGMLTALWGGHLAARGRAGGVGRPASGPAAPSGADRVTGPHAASPGAAPGPGPGPVAAP
jgi:hypothetical protein